MNIKEIRALTKLSQVNFANKYGIPRRTLEDWESGKHNPAPYVLDMLEKMVLDNEGRFVVWEMQVATEDIKEDIKPGCTYGCWNLNYDPVVHVEKFKHISDALHYMRLHHFSVDRDFVTEYHLYETDGDDFNDDVIAWSTEDSIELN